MKKPAPLTTRELVYLFSDSQVIANNSEHNHDIFTSLIKVLETKPIIEKDIDEPCLLIDKQSYVNNNYVFYYEKPSSMLNHHDYLVVKRINFKLSNHELSKWFNSNNADLLAKQLMRFTDLTDDEEMLFRMLLAFKFDSHLIVDFEYLWNNHNNLIEGCVCTKRKLTIRVSKLHAFERLSVSNIVNMYQEERGKSKSLFEEDVRQFWEIAFDFNHSHAHSSSSNPLSFKDVQQWAECENLLYGSFAISCDGINKLKQHWLCEAKSIQRPFLMELFSITDFLIEYKRNYRYDVTMSFTLSELLKIVELRQSEAKAFFMRNSSHDIGFKELRALFTVLNDLVYTTQKSENQNALSQQINIVIVQNDVFHNGQFQLFAEVNWDKQQMNEKQFSTWLLNFNLDLLMAQMNRNNHNGAKPLMCLPFASEEQVQKDFIRVVRECLRKKADGLNQLLNVLEEQVK